METIYSPNTSPQPARFRRRALAVAIFATASTVLCLSSSATLAAPADADQPLVLRPVKVAGEAVAADPLINMDKPAKTGKLPVSVHETPASIAVIEEEFIRDSGAKNIQDALLYTSGVYAGRYGFDTRGDWASVRGLGVSTYQDGLRSIYGFYNSVRTEVYALQQIEVLKGPSSVLYGQSELGGIINAVSKLPQAQQQGEIWAQVGSFERKQLGADVTGPLDDDGKWLYRLVALQRDSETQVDYVNDDAVLLMPSLTWRPTEATEITLLLNHQQAESKVSSQFLPSKGTIDPAPRGRIDPGRFAGEPDWDRYDTERTDLTLFASQTLGEHWNMALTARHTETESETREIYTAVGQVPDDAGNIRRTVHQADRETDVDSFDLRLEGSFGLGFTQHTLAVGVDYQDALWEEDNYLSTLTTSTFNVYDPVYGTLDLANLPTLDRPDNTIEQLGIYVIDHVEIGNVIVSAALRRDDSESTVLNLGATPDYVREDKETSKHFGLMYKFANGISPYISYTDAFVPNLGTNNGLGLAPTTGEQKEAGIKYLSPARDLSVAFAWFDIEQERRITQGLTPDGVRQVGAVIDGWELEVKKVWGGFELLANYTAMDAIEDSTGHRLSAIAENLASVWGRYEMANGLRFGLGARHTGSITGANGAPEIDSVALYDAMIGYAWGSWDFSLDGKNLGDKTYISWCRGQGLDCGYGELRTVSGNVRYRF